MKKLGILRVSKQGLVQCWFIRAACRHRHQISSRAPLGGRTYDSCHYLHGAAASDVSGKRQQLRRSIGRLGGSCPEGKAQGARDDDGRHTTPQSSAHDSTSAARTPTIQHTGIHMSSALGTEQLVWVGTDELPSGGVACVRTRTRG